MPNPPARHAELLETIRQAETEANRRLAVEHEAAAARLAAARQAAEARATAAEAAGRAEGERRRAAARQEAEQEAAEVVEHAHAQAEALRHAGEAALTEAVDMALRFVLEGEHAP
jgi:V/A-type H+-transporting ATPase subunit G/H